MLAQLAAQGLTTSVVAIDNMTIDRNLTAGKREQLKKGPWENQHRSGKARLSTLNFVKALEQCASPSLGWADLCVIFEDDTVLHPHFMQEALLTVRQLPANWNLLHMCPQFLWQTGKNDPRKRFHLSPGWQGQHVEVGPTPPSHERRYFRQHPPPFYAPMRHKDGHWGPMYGEWGLALGGPTAILVKRSHAAYLGSRLADAAATERDQIVISIDTYFKNKLYLPTHYIAREPQLCRELMHAGSGKHELASSSWFDTETAAPSSKKEIQGAAKQAHGVTREEYGLDGAGKRPISALLNLSCLPSPSPPPTKQLNHRTPCNGFVVMVTVSSGYFDFFSNWLRFASRHIDPATCLMAVAEDAATISMLARHLPAANVLHSHLTAGATAAVNSSSAFEYGSAAFGALVRQRPLHIASFLRRGIGVLYSDLDLVWARNPLPALLSLAEPPTPARRLWNAIIGASSPKWAFDIVAMDDDPDHVGRSCSPHPKRIDEMYLCTCFLFVAPSVAAITLMEDWKARMDQFAWKHVNQFAFNLAVGQPRSPLQVRVLDRYAFPSGNVWNAKDETVRNAQRVRAQAQERHFVVHANYVKGGRLKRNMLRSAGVWMPAMAPTGSVPGTALDYHQLQLSHARKGKQSDHHFKLAGRSSWVSTSTRLRVATVFNISDKPVFNLAFQYQKGVWQAAGRYWNHETFRMRGCGDIAHGPHRHMNHAGMMNVVALIRNVSARRVTAMQVPTIVRCGAIGEPKWAGAFPNTLNLYTHWICPERLYKRWREHWGHFGRDVTNNFLKSPMRNYLVHLKDPKNATLLSYQLRPEKQFAAKNFLFFRVRQQVYVETLFNPHKVYALDADTGLMHLSGESTFTMVHTAVGLSAGPVRLNATTFLSAAHVSRGGWQDAYRMTFFYMFDARPPFKIRCATRPLSFGYSASLEYCTSLQLIRKHLFVGIGYDNCFSALVEVPTEDIISRCVPSAEASAQA